ncbi:hypothetical protein R4K54_04030 [Brachyspira murdochii]|uniref:hypothetical protein n=1 Tax=Brachyspira murdochii TaxID=84378 RepID=UPI0030043C55
MFDDNKVKTVIKLFKDIEYKVSIEANDESTRSIISGHREKLKLIPKKNKYNNDRKILSLGILADFCNDLKVYIKPSDLLDFSTIKIYINEVDLNNLKWEKDFRKIIEIFLERLDKE